MNSFRERDIDAKLSKMHVDLAAWGKRVESRKRDAQREIDKRNQILAEVRICILISSF